MELPPPTLLQRELVSSSTSTSSEMSMEYPTRISQAMAKTDLQHEFQNDLSIKLTVKWTSKTQFIYGKELHAVRNLYRLFSCSCSITRLIRAWTVDTWTVDLFIIQFSYHTNNSLQARFIARQDCNQVTRLDQIIRFMMMNKFVPYKGCWR
jgi:hypothetical protein